MTYQNEWFTDRFANKLPPLEAILDCSAPGQPADEPVAYWIKRLQFDGPAWLIRQHLRGYGAWNTAELCNHQQNLERLFWCWCCDLREEHDLTEDSDLATLDCLPLYLGC